MFNQHNKSEKQYSISIKSPNGNTVGFINLSSQFIRSVIGKREEMITVADIEKINNGNFEEYLKKMHIEITGIQQDKEPIPAEEY